MLSIPVWQLGMFCLARARRYGEIRVSTAIIVETGRSCRATMVPWEGRREKQSAGRHTGRPHCTKHVTPEKLRATDPSASGTNAAPMYRFRFCLGHQVGVFPGIPRVDTSRCVQSWRETEEISARPANILQACRYMCLPNVPMYLHVRICAC